MLRISVLVLFAAGLFAQNSDNPFDKPPAGVDKALRARITEFYQDHVKGQFRKAEALVAEDTKDFFYSHNKPAYLSCETGKIQYSENYTRAKATVICEQYVMMPGFANKPMKVPFPSTWKLVHGKWYWYVDPEQARMTPFGKMTPGTTPATSPMPAVIPTSPDAFMKQVRADKESVSLKPGQTDKVTIANAAPGLMTISLMGQVPGVEAKLDHGDLKIGDKAILTLHAGEDARPGTFSIRVEQTGEIIPIRVDVVR